MIDLEQEVEVKWGTPLDKYYKSKGYEYTKSGDVFYVKAKDLTPSSTALVQVVCDNCGKIMYKKYLEYNRIMKNSGRYYCKSCTTRENVRKRYPKELLFDKFLQFCKRNNYKPLSQIEDFITVKTRLLYECPIHGIKNISIDEIGEDNVGCRECSYDIIRRKNKKSIEDVIEIIESKGNELLNPDDYISVGVKNLIIKCGICGKSFTTSLASQIAGDGACLFCSHIKTAKGLTLTTEYLNKKYNSNGKIMLLNPEDYVANNANNLEFVCRICGKSFITSMVNYDYGQDRCSSCTHFKSSGEEIIENFLIKHNIIHVFQYKTEECCDKRQLPFDFYLPDFRTMIEFDGKHHFEPIYGQERFEKTQYHDKIKNQYCLENNITMIRIPYFDGHNIEQILTKKLGL